MSLALIVSLATSGRALAGVEVDLAGGRGSERLAWSVGVPSQGPNVLRELSFQRTTTTEGGVKLRWTSDRTSWAIQLDGRVGVLEEGRVREDVFTRNDRQGLIGQSQGRIDGNALLDIGIRTDVAVLRAGSEALTGGIWAGGGWRVSQQSWQIIREELRILGGPGPRPLNLHSYRARWQGPEFALLGQALIGQRVELRGEMVGWPLIWYEGLGRREDLALKHGAPGYGLGSTLEGRYWFRDRAGQARAFLGIGWHWEWMKTREGMVKFTQAAFGGTTEGVANLVLNTAERQGQFWFLSVGRTF